MPDMKNTGPGREFAARLVMVFGALLTLGTIYILRDLLLLVFAAILVAVLLDVLASPIARVMRCPRELAAVLGFLCVAALVTVLAIGFGREITGQLALLGEKLPEAQSEILALAQSAGVGIEQLDSLWAEARSHAGAAMFDGPLGNALTATGGMLLAIIVGIYLAAQPDLYTRGVYRLIPARHHKFARKLAASISDGLKHWMLGQLVVMTFIGVMTGLGAWLLGLPAPFALGLIAGLLEFMPYLGPILTVIPAVLLGITVDLETAVLAFIWLVIVQQIEGYFITPVVQRKAVSLPPAISILAMAVGGVLFGVLGVVLAIPLAVVIFAASNVFLDQPDSTAQAG